MSVDRYIDAKNEKLEIDGNKIQFWTHEAIAQPGQHLARLFWENGAEIAAIAPTRGEAMLQLGEHLRAVGQKLIEQAFVQEGAVRIPK